MFPEVLFQLLPALTAPLSTSADHINLSSQTSPTRVTAALSPKNKLRVLAASMILHVTSLA